MITLEKSLRGLSQPTLLGSDTDRRFQVVDRFGNGYADVPVTVSVASGELLSSASMTTDAEGYIVAKVRNSTLGRQEVVATVTADGISQIGNPANPAAGLAASATTATAAVIWSNVFATTNPTVVGTAKAGATLTATPGAWSSVGALKLAFAWFACPAAFKADGLSPLPTLTGCAAIKGATKSTLKVPANLVGKFLAARVTATASGQRVDALTMTTAKVKK